MTIIHSLLYNRYFFCLLALILLYCIIKGLSKFPYLSQNQNNNAFLNSLNYYYIENIYYDIFVVIFYAIMYFGFLFSLRYNSIGIALNIPMLLITTYDSNAFMTTFLIIGCVIIYIASLNHIFYPNLIRLYFYFNQYQWFINTIEKMNSNLHIISNKINNIQYEIAKYTFNKKDFLERCEKNKNHIMRLERKQKIKTNLDKKFLLQQAFWEKVNNNKILLLMIDGIQRFFSLFKQISRILRFSPLSFVLLILIYDVYSGMLHFIYYGLFFYFTMIWLRKIRLFFSVKDPCDYNIGVYFYKNEVPYKKIQQLLEDYKSNDSFFYSNIGNDTKIILDNKELYIKYFLDDFTAYYVMYPQRKLNDKILNNNAKRVLNLMLIFLGIVFYYVERDKYTLLISNLNLNLWMIFLVVFLVLLVFQQNVIEEKQETSEEVLVILLEKKIYKYSFRILFLITVGIMCYIMLKNKLMIFPVEILIDFGNIKVIETYNLEEKKYYLMHYLELLQKLLDINNEHLCYVKYRLDDELDIKNDTTLEMIREKIEHIVNDWYSRKISLLKSAHHFYIKWSL